MQNEKLQAIVERAIHGEAEAFTELLEAKGRDILYIAMNLMKNLHDAEDVAQEVAVKIKNNITTLKSPEAFQAWMYRIILNTCNEMRRKSKKYKEEAPMDQYSYILHEENREFLPYEYVEDTEKRKILMDVIKQLPYRNRECIILFYYEGLSYAQIAALLEISTKKVDHALNRAKKLIRKGLEQRTSADISAHNIIAVGALPVLTQAMQIDAMETLPKELVHSIYGTLSESAIKGSVVQAAAKVGISSGAKAVIGLIVTTTVVGASLIAFDAILKKTENEHQEPLQTNTEKPVSSSAVHNNAETPMDTANPSAAEEDYLIYTLEDMIGKQKADELRRYVAGKTGYDGINAFIQGLKMTQEQIGVHDTSKEKYTLYALTKKNKQLMVIVKKTADDDTLGVVYKFTEATEQLPKDIELVLCFYAW